MSAPKASRKPTNLSLDAELVRDAVAEARAERWRTDNAAAVASSNRWVDENGLPLDRHRQF